MSQIPTNVSKAQRQMRVGLVFGLLAGALTAALTLVVPVIPAIVIGGLGLGVVARWFLWMWSHGQR
jgi:hypothetical protein